MSKTAATFLLLGLMLGGCGTTYSAQATADADRKAQAAYAECDNRLRIGALRSYRQAADCAKPKVMAAYQENGFPFMDLIEFDQAVRAAGAERIDTGFASPADVKRELVEFDRRVVAERDRRLGSQRATAGTGSYVPLNSLLVGLDSLTARALPRAGDTCFTVGSFKRCD
jgi:hypothetical protein